MVTITIRGTAVEIPPAVLAAGDAAVLAFVAAQQTPSRPTSPAPVLTDEET